MSDIKNTLSSSLANLIKLQRNNSEILTKLSDVVNSDADTVTLTIEDISNDSIKTVTIPSLGSLKKDIQRIDENITQISGLNEKDASVKLSDGTFRTIIKSTLKKSAENITSIEIPTEFNSKNNWFFDSFLNPLLYIGLQYPSQLNPDTTKVKMQKFILNLDTDDKLTIFNEEIKNNPDLTYADFLDIVSGNGIQYVIDDEILDLPPVDPAYYGNFSVLRVFQENEDVVVDGVTATRKLLKFQLDKLSYNDKNSSTLETQQLKKGDSLLVNKNDKNTRYVVTNIDFETTTISVDLAEGYDSVNIGSEMLSFYPSESISPEIRVGIGFNEYLAVFLKPINPDSNRPADNYSPCIGFYSNELTIKDKDDSIKTLETYYKESVVDFGAVLLSMSQENIPPVSKAVTPDSPVLVTTDFKVAQINKHVTDGQSNEEIKSLNKEKNSLKSELSNIDKAISSLRQEINTKNYKSDIERDSDDNKLTTLREKREATQTLYNSVVSDIMTKAEDQNTSSASAKYRLRGFFPLPKNKIASDGTEQATIQFKVEYRYLTKGGSANNLEEYTYTDEEGNEQKGVYSNWVKIKTDLRERAFDSITGRYYWVDQQTENGEQVNINQLDVPIRPNETLEIRAKSISEAGFPSNAVESEWSDIMTYEFPDDLGLSKEVLSIVGETKEEQVKVNLNEDLTERGVYTHIDDQFTQSNKTWKHQSVNIASGFLSAERNIISLLDYLKQLENKVDALEAQINKSVGVLLVKIEDENQNQLIVQENSTVPIFAGNYKDDVSSLDKPKGTIITKNYFIRIENDAATPIELISGVSGNFAGSKFQRALAPYTTVPVGLSNPDQEDIDNLIDGGTAFRLPNQSSQVKGQYVYVRNTDITTTKSVYATNGSLENDWYKFDIGSISGALPTENYQTDPNYFIWTGTQTSAGNQEGVEPFVLDANKIYVHCEHPDLQNSVPTDSEWLDDNTTVSVFSSRRLGTDAFYYQQGQFNLLGTKTNKTSFRENDKYLLGTASCGAYLYLSPLKYEDLRVNGNDETSIKQLEQGSSNAFIFQLVYQYRMTDYFGPGTDGIGRIGGSVDITQIEYRKVIGLDIFNDEKKFSFDIEITSRYKSNSVSASDVPSQTFQNTTNRTLNIVNQITPSIE